MKLLYCPKCYDTITMTHDNVVRICRCGETSGKYLKDKITAVVAEGSIVFGIDNNSFINAVKTSLQCKEHERYQDIRLDFFFCGWVPTKPGEVIFVKNTAHVKAYDYYQEKGHTSQNPSTPINEVGNAKLE